MTKEPKRYYTKGHSDKYADKFDSIDWSGHTISNEDMLKLIEIADAKAESGEITKLSLRDVSYEDSNLRAFLHNKDENGDWVSQVIGNHESPLGGHISFKMSRSFAWKEFGYGVAVAGIISIIIRILNEGLL